MNYNDILFWLGILDIFNSSANKILIINFSNSCKANSFHVSNAFQTSVYINEKPCLEKKFIFFFMFRLFSFHLCSNNY